MPNDHLSLPERISILETEWDQARADLTDIKTKLDMLLHLKSRGMGAFWLVTLLITSAVAGMFSNIMQFFSTMKPHP